MPRGDRDADSRLRMEAQVLGGRGETTANRPIDVAAPIGSVVGLSKDLIDPTTSRASTPAGDRLTRNRTRSPRVPASAT
jgi:hypothetical protein